MIKVIRGINMPLINEASDEDLIEELANRGIDILDIKHCTDKELIAEMDRRWTNIVKMHDDLMEGKI